MNSFDGASAGSVRAAPIVPAPRIRTTRLAKKAAGRKGVAFLTERLQQKRTNKSIEREVDTPLVNEVPADPRQGLARVVHTRE